MKFIRYRAGLPEYRGILEGETVKRINGSIFHEFNITEDKLPLEKITLLPPILPSKIIGLRNDYPAGMASGEHFSVFIKPPSSIAAGGTDIIMPLFLKEATAKAELAVIIGKKCRNAKESRAEEYILGYTGANDVTGVSPAFKDACGAEKYFDTFTPLGPAIEISEGHKNRRARTFVNGRLMRESDSSDTVCSIPFIVAYLSSIMTLLPGDVILAGILSEPVPIFPGDLVETEIEGAGRLSNRVKSQGSDL